MKTLKKMAASTGRFALSPAITVGRLLSRKQQLLSLFFAKKEVNKEENLKRLESMSDAEAAQLAAKAQRIKRIFVGLLAAFIAAKAYVLIAYSATGFSTLIWAFMCFLICTEILKYAGQELMLERRKPVKIGDVWRHGSWF